MPEHDPIPPHIERAALAWARYKKLMTWMAAAAVVAVVLALLFLKRDGEPMPLSMAVATAAGVGLSVLLGTALMGLVYFSSHSGYDDWAGGRGEDE